MPELVITPDNYQQHTGAGQEQFFFNGEARILNARASQRPYGQVEGVRAIEDVILLIPRDEWQDRIKQNDSEGSWLKNVAGDIPCKDQDGLGYCFTSDTKISLLDGTERSLKELMSYEGDIGVYSYDLESGRVVPGKATRPFRTRCNVQVLKVTLDNGESVRCTEDHPWLMRDGTYRRADKLRAGDSLMPLYRRMSEKADDHNCGRIGYEMVLDPDIGWKFTHVAVVDDSTVVMDYVDGELVEAEKTDKHCIRHHLNFNKYDNRPENIAWMKFYHHFRFHRDFIAHRNRTDEARKRSSENLTELHKDQAFAARRDKRGGDVLRRLWCEQLDYWSKLSSERMTKLNNDPDFAKASAQAASVHMSKMHKDPGFVKRRDKRNNTPVVCPECGMVCGNIGSLGIHIQQKHQPIEQLECEDCGRNFSGKRGLTSHRAQVHANHKVVSVEPDGQEDVYDITVEGYHNFALSAGVFVHNCHAYGTVSPMESCYAVAGHPYVELSAESVGGIVTNWRNEGAYPEDDLAVAVKYGACAASFMDKPNSINPKKWKAGWEKDALNHRVLEWFDLRVPGKVFDAVVTCILLRFPIGLGYAWWGHFVHGGFRARYNPKTKLYEIENRNSWGKSYGNNGYFWLQEGTRNGQGTPDWAFGIRNVTPSTN